MSEAAPTFSVRISDQDLPNLSLRFSAESAAWRELTPRQYYVWKALHLHLLKYGSLPQGFKEMAAICKIGARAFAAMAQALARHMDIDASDNRRWTHFDVIASRGDLPIAIDLEVGSGEASPHRAVRQAAAGVMHTNRRLRLATSDGTAAETALHSAKHDANACKTDVQNLGEFASAGAMADARFASASPGSIDRSSLEILEENDRSIRAGASADAANPDANNDAKCSANEASSGSESADGGPVPLPSRSLAEVDDDALIAALRAAGGEKIPAVILNATDLAPLRLLVAEGCELERDVVPAVANFARGCDGVLRTFKARPIREKAIASRDAALQARARLGPAATPLVFVLEGSPPWRAWLRHKGVKSHYVTEKQDDRTKRGSWFPTIWPPGWDDARLATVQQSRSSVGNGVGGTDGSLPPPGG